MLAKLCKICSNLLQVNAIVLYWQHLVLVRKKFSFYNIIEKYKENYCCPVKLL